jgi:hypothetical protein
MKAGFMMSVLTAVIGLTSCTDKDNGNFLKSTITFEFNSGTHGWTGDFADYPAADSVFYELQFAHASLPAPLNTSTKALKISGNNHSDDLFMFVKRKVTGLIPYYTYNVTYDLELASNAPTGALGAGGSPGESVVIKVGATKVEPKKVAQGYGYIMNIDKGNQTQGGTDMKAIGNIGVSDTTTVYTVIKRNNFTAPLQATTDKDGSLWLIVGTDSGFEATTTLYFKKIEVTITDEAE